MSEIEGGLFRLLVQLVQFFKHFSTNVYQYLEIPNFRKTICQAACLKSPPRRPRTPSAPSFGSAR